MTDRHSLKRGDVVLALTNHVSHAMNQCPVDLKGLETVYRILK